MNSAIILAFSGVLLFLLFGAHFQQSHQTPPTPSNNSPISNAKNLIITVACQKEDIFILTRHHKDYRIFQYPLRSLDTQTHRLSPIPPPEETNVATKWPILHDFGSHKIINSALIRDTRNHSILFAVRQNWRHDNETGFFDFHSPTSWEYSSINWEDGHVWLSSGEVNSLYQVAGTNAPGHNHHHQQRQLTLQKFTFAYNAPGISQNTLMDSTDLEATSPELYLCQRGSTTMIYLSKRKCSRPLNLKISSGAVCKGRFYLFGVNSVYAFDKMAFDKPNMGVMIQVNSLKGFFGSNGK